MPASRPRERARVTYRKTTVSDLEVLVEHRHRMWSDIGHRTEAEITEHDSRYRPWAKRRLRSGELVGCVAESNGGRVVASGLVWFRPDQPRPKLATLVSPYILSMYTEPDWRGNGIATRIVRELLVACRERGYPNVELHASRFGRRLYARLGFERTWEMRSWLDRRFAPKKLLPPPRARRKRKKGLDRRG
jgi:GNAT superfamily N-acetyltransferase